MEQKPARKARQKKPVSKPAGQLAQGAAGDGASALGSPGASAEQDITKASAAFQRVGLAEVVGLADYAQRIFDSLRMDMLKPHPRKLAPQYNGSQLAQICQIDPKQVTYLARRGDLPSGRLDGSRRIFTLAEVHEWARRVGPFEKKAEGQDAVVISCVNFKGGSTKTSTAFSLAQGLSHRGRKVLLVDLDPQASATTLTGLLPAAEIEEWATAAPVTYLMEPDHPKDLQYAVQQTYWDGMDLIPSSPPLFQAEIMLPLLSRDPKILWWSLIDKALEPLRKKYDVIVIDTAPSLSYLALNAMWASDGLLMPLPPDNLDFASSVSFWKLLSETMSGLSTHRQVEKKFEFIRVLVSRMDGNSPSNQLVREWISGTYSRYLMPGYIPRSTVNTMGSTQFQTVYDIVRYDGDQRTYQKLRAAWDEFVGHMDQQIVRIWKSRIDGQTTGA
jgi:chromosome partitioning protein